MAADIPYRADIDGLRAVAVTSVICYHFGATWLPGGFTGVDVFFVISGYLITSIVKVEVEQHRFSILGFYKRRILRIFPALLFLLFALAGFGWVGLMPNEYSELGKSAAYSAVGLANLYFFWNTGYFDPAADLQPLLHIWSLGVEEQFYLVWPVALFGLLSASFLRNRALAILIIAIAIGFTLNIMETNRDPKAAFYLPHARAWELALGAGIAFLPAIGSKLASYAIAITGAAVMLTGFLLVSADVTFPGYYALLPTMGAALIIWPKQRTALSAALSVRPVVYVGKISYSLYLWHWPIIVFFRHFNFERMPDAIQLIALTAATFAASAFSYHFVEQPARKPRARKALATIAVAAFVVVGGISIAEHKGIPHRLPERVLALADGANDYSARRPECHRTDKHDPSLENSCRYGEQSAEPRSAIWGDSHGMEIGEAIGNKVGKSGRSVLGLTYSSCPAAQDFTAPLQKGCPAFNTKVLSYLIEAESIDTIYLASYYEFYFNSSDRASLESGLERTVSVLTAAGKKVVIIASNPEIGFSVPPAAARLAMIGQSESLSVDLASHKRFSSDARTLIDRLAATYPDVTVLDPADVLCSVDGCPMVRNGRAILFDDNHLSRYGAALVAEAFDF